MLPARLLSYRVSRTGNVLPRYLGSNDEPWLRALLERFEFLVGESRKGVQRALRDPLPGDPGRERVAMARHVLSSECGWERPPQDPSPRDVRAVVFGGGAREPDRHLALEHAGRELALTPSEIMTRLFADLPANRRLGTVPSELSPYELALTTNLALVQGILRNALRVSVRAQGGARRLVRQALVGGLICTAHSEGPDAYRLNISGPYSLFRRTRIYGRVLAQLVPLLTWCDRYSLTAVCALEGEERTLSLRHGDPIRSAREPRRYDSKLEERFARDFSRLQARTWRLVREPKPVAAGGTLIFPDFGLVHTFDPGQSWLLEIVGFWTPDYLSRKCARLQAAGIDRLLICVDEDRACDRADFPPGAKVIFFRRRIPAKQVLHAVTEG